MKVLSLNCQRGYQPNLKHFLQKILESGMYDFMLLQEFAKEVPSFVHSVGPYKVLQAHDAKIKEMAQTCIVYRKDYQLLENNFTPFHFTRIRHDPVMGFRHSTFGSLFARFEIENKHFLVGSAHLHSGISRAARASQVSRIKEQAISLTKAGDIVIFGGDYNFGLPGERGRAERILLPQFVCTTLDIGHTLDGRYSENVPHLPNRIAAFLGLVGIPTRLRTDHFFVDQKTAAQGAIHCRKLPDRVSDHNPIELVIADSDL